MFVAIRWQALPLGEGANQFAAGLAPADVQRHFRTITPIDPLVRSSL